MLKTTPRVAADMRKKGRGRGGLEDIGMTG